MTTMSVASHPEDSGADRPADDYRSRVLRQRRLFLAKAREEMAAGDQVDVLEISLGNEVYAFERQYVEEAFIPTADILPIPFTPLFVLGVVRRRGRVLAVIDLAELSHGAVPRLAERSGPPPLVVLRHGGMELALAVDAIRMVRRIDRQDIGVDRGAISEALAAWTIGVTAEPVILLDAGRLLEDPALIVDLGV
jgi:chemotaxis signal transduction protein